MIQFDQEDQSEIKGRPQESFRWLLIFRKFDHKRDGFIPVEEIYQNIQTIMNDFALSDAQCDRLLQDADSNKDKMIDFGEFCSLMAKAKQMRTKQLIFVAAKAVLPRYLREEKLSYLAQYSCVPPPFMLVLFTIIEIAIYIYYAFTTDSATSISGSIPDNSSLIYNPCKREQVWRYLSYALVHVGVFHIVFNVIVQLLLGIPLELVHQWRVALVYILGIIAGSLSVSLVDPHIFLAGASGGVYALLAAHLADLTLNWAEMEMAIFRLIAFLLFVGVDVGIALYQRYGAMETRVSYAAHIGGSLAGFLMGVVLLRNLQKKKWERIAWWICLIVAVLLSVFALLWNIFYTEYYLTGGEHCLL